MRGGYQHVPGQSAADFALVACWSDDSGRSSPARRLPMRPMCAASVDAAHLRSAHCTARAAAHTQDPKEHMSQSGNTARDHASEQAHAAVSLHASPDPEPRGRGASVRAHVQEWQPVYLAFALSRMLVLAVGFGAELVMRLGDVDPSRWRPFAFAETFPHYANVATNGYTLENAFNHPLLPSLMAAGGAVGIPHALTAAVVSNLAFLAGLVMMAMLGERYVGKPAAVRGAVYLAIAPFAYWFSVASTESLMLVLIAGSAMLALRATPAGWLGAGALGALAVLTRPPGALIGLLLLCIAIGQLRDRRLTLAGTLSALTAGVMIPAALIGFFAYLKDRTGDAFASLHAQEDFNREVTLDGPIKALGSGLRNTLGGSPGQAIELVATFGAAAFVVWFAVHAAGRQWEIRGWTLFGVASLLLPLMTGVLWQMPRFALLMPPVFWMLGVLGVRHRKLHHALLVLFPLGLAIKVAAAVVGVEG